MRIVCVGYMHGVGGAQRQILLLANALAEMGNEVHFIALCECNICFDMNSKIQLHDLSNIEKRRGIGIVNRYNALYKLYKKIKPEVTIHYWLQSAYLTAFMKKSISGKIIYSERLDPNGKSYNTLLKIIRDISFKRVDGFVFQSEGAKNLFNERIKKRSIVIHNPISIIPVEYLNSLSGRDNRIVSVGRLHKQKNQRLLIAAFARIADSFPECTMEIYGEGELREELQTIIDSLGLNRRILLMGNRQNIYQCIYNARLFVFSSDYEGMPNALMEAYCLGLPCISTDCSPGGAREIIEDKVDGIIVPVGDVDKMSIAMEDLLSNSDYANNLGKKAKERAGRFNREYVFGQWSNYIGKIVKGAQDDSKE